MDYYIEQVKQRIEKHQHVPPVIVIEKVVFERPFFEKYRVNDRWDFVATPSVEYPHGHTCFGGYVERDENKQWVAKSWSINGSPAPTRERAIAQVASDVYRRGIKQNDEELKRREDEYDIRMAEWRKEQLNNIAINYFDRLLTAAKELNHAVECHSPVSMDDQSALIAHIEAELLKAKVQS